jgi:WD40 repeat protein
MPESGKWLISLWGPIPIRSWWDLERADEPVARSDEDEIIQKVPLAIRFVEEDRSIVVVDREGELRQWDRNNPRLKKLGPAPLSSREPPFQKFKVAYRQAAFLAGGRRLAVLGISNGLQVTDLTAGKVLFQIRHANRFAASPDERTLAVTSIGTHSELEWTSEGEGSRTPTLKKIATDGTIALLDGETGKEMLRMAIPGSEVWAMAFSPDGKILAATTGWETGRIHLYEVATGKEIRTIATPALRCPALAFTPDGKRLVTGMADASVLIWDLPSNP